MTPTELWKRYCTWYRHYPEVGMSLDISRMRFGDSFFAEMEPLSSKAFAAMRELEGGSIANPDESRMVGHYWLRDEDLSPDPAMKEAISSAKSQVLDFAAKVHQGAALSSSGKPFSAALIVGIGGSALGPQLIADALWDRNNKMSLYFCDNTDPDGIARTLEEIGSALDSTLVIVISKSGGTIETRNGMLAVMHVFAENGIAFEKNAVAVTGEGSKLYALAKEGSWLEIFPMWDWVGGRTSLFSAVGLLPAALQGIDIEGYCTGGKEMDRLSREENAEQNPAMLLALMWYYAGSGKGEKDMVVLPYRDRLCLFSRYLQQLVMESIGKELDLDGNKVCQGLAVYGNKGSTDQHAYVQQLRDGLHNFFVTFIETANDKAPFRHSPESVCELEVEQGVTSGDYLNGFFQGTRRALYENGRDSITLCVSELNASTLGSLIALYDRAVGFYASLVNVNAYHQPGVEAGKKAAAKVIELQKALLEKLSSASEALSAEQLAAALEAPEEVETVFRVLEHLAANESRGIARLGSCLPQEARYQRR